MTNVLLACRCGNPTLKRVTVTLNEDGSQQIHINSKRQLTSRGKKFSLPAPKGGKHFVRPVLTADDLKGRGQQVTKLARNKTNAMDPDYVAGRTSLTPLHLSFCCSLCRMHSQQLLCTFLLTTLLSTFFVVDFYLPLLLPRFYLGWGTFTIGFFLDIVFIHKCKLRIGFGAFRGRTR